MQRRSLQGSSLQESSLQGSRPVIFISLADMKEPGMNGVLPKLSDSLFRLYNPWSIINYLREGEFKSCWSNTSGNALASRLIREGDADSWTACFFDGAVL